jgi:predicted transcriptional regulator of viral defense system
MNNNNTFNNLSKREVNVITKLSYYGKQVVSNSEIKKYFPEKYKYTNQVIYNLKKKKILSPIKRGFYSFNNMGSLPIGRQINNYTMGNIFFPKKNYYIGYYNMFNYYGLTQQLPQTTFIINTSLSATKIINGLQYKFIKVKDEYMYGIEEKEMSGGIVKISDKEKTLIDMIYKYNYVGGIIPAMEKLEEIIKNKNLDIKKFIDYAVRFPQIKVRKIIGIVLDRAEIQETLIQPLYDSIKSSSLISLNWNNRRKGTINKKWGVILDDSQK